MYKFINQIKFISKRIAYQQIKKKKNDQKKIRNLSIPPTFFQDYVHGFVICQPVLVIFIVGANEADIRVGLRKSYGARFHSGGNKERKQSVYTGPVSFKCTIPFASYRIIVNTDYTRSGGNEGRNGCTADCKLTSLPK